MADVLKRVRFVDPEENTYLRDCERIVQIFADRGYEISIEDAKKAWEAHSDKSAAGWLMFPRGGKYGDASIEESDARIFRDCAQFIAGVDA